MAIVRLDTTGIVDWPSFHAVFRNLMGFPDFYGENMNAWIDCMTYLDEDTGMVNLTLNPGEILLLEIIDTEHFNARVPDIMTALIECTAFVNRRYLASGQIPMLALMFL